MQSHNNYPTKQIEKMRKFFTLRPLLLWSVFPYLLLMFLVTSCGEDAPELAFISGVVRNGEELVSGASVTISDDDEISEVLEDLISGHPVALLRWLTKPLWLPLPQAQLFSKRYGENEQRRPLAFGICLVAIVPQLVEPPILECIFWTL